jgi:hypothetical protein
MMVDCSLNTNPNPDEEHLHPPTTLLRLCTHLQPVYVYVMSEPLESTSESVLPLCASNT